MIAARWWPPRLRAQLAAAEEAIGELAAALAGQCRCPEELRAAVSGAGAWTRTASLTLTLPGHGDPPAEVILVLSGEADCCEVRGALASAAIALRPPHPNVPLIASWDFPQCLPGAAARRDGTFGICLSSKLTRTESLLARSLLFREAQRLGWRVNAGAPRPQRRHRRPLAVATVACAAALAAIFAICLSWATPLREPAHPHPSPAGIPAVISGHRR